MIDWEDEATCRQHVDLFHRTIVNDISHYSPLPSSEDLPVEVLAKRVCWDWCPVREDCLKWALGRVEDYGVLGGLNSRERIRRQGRRSQMRP